MSQLPTITERFLDDDIMTFFGQAGQGIKDIISFGSGKPDEHYFDMDRALDHIRYYMDHLRSLGSSETELSSTIGQYTPVKGIINSIIKKYLETDHAFSDIDADDLILTTGAQEAFVLAILRFCEQGRHSVISEMPAYIGFDSFARLNGYDVHYVPVDQAGGIDPDLLVAQLNACREQGKPVRIVYVCPDFQNPTGTVMPVEKRKHLLELAREWDFLLLEDNAYRIFRYGGTALPSMKELDIYDRVIYVESLSKSVFPSIRIGIVYVTGSWSLNGQELRKSASLAEMKAYVTVNNATIDQALVAGILLQYNYSLQAYNGEKVAAFKSKRDTMMRVLDRHIAKFPLPLKYNVPEGGFFLELCLPFSVSREQLDVAIRKYQVIFCPMWFFYNDKNVTSDQHSIRLSFSKPMEADIPKGIERLFDFFYKEMLTLQPVQP